MKVKKYEKREIEPSCAYCAKGGTGAKCQADAGAKQKQACRKFKYDPLKRVPRRPSVPQEFSAEDFAL